MSRFISKTVQDRDTLVIEYKYELTHTLLNDVISNDIDWCMGHSLRSRTVVSFSNY